MSRHRPSRTAAWVAGAVAGAVLTAAFQAGPKMVPNAAATSAAATAKDAFQPLLTVTDPETLTRLETGGLDAGAVAFARPGAARSLAGLTASAPGWSAIVDVLRADMRELYAGDPKYGVGMRHAHRGFDPAWLTSPATRFELAAVVNRIDRRAMNPGTCGELRFVYRLAYTTKAKAKAKARPVTTTDSAAEPGFSSRLPFTLNVVFLLPDDGQRCARQTRALVTPDDVATVMRARPRLKSVEVNVQSARWPSTVRPDLGGHADYILRVFHPTAASPGVGTLAPAPLENTPDAARIARDPALATALGAWLRKPGVLADIDRGTVCSRTGSPPGAPSASRPAGCRAPGMRCSASFSPAPTSPTCPWQAPHTCAPRRRC